MRRRRQEPRPGFAILRQDGTWYAAGDSQRTFWRERIRDAAIFDAEKTAADTIDERLTLMHPKEIFEIVPVDRRAVFGG